MNCILRIILVLVTSQQLCAEEASPDYPLSLNLAASVQPIDEHAIYTEPGYATWDGMLFKEDDTYFLIYSRWKSDGGSWLTTSDGSERYWHKGRFEMAIGKGGSVLGDIRVSNSELLK